MILFFKWLQISTFFEIFLLTTEISNIENLIRQNKKSKSFLLTKLFKQNQNIFSSFDLQSKYFERELFERKLKLELTLRLLEKSLANNVSNEFLNNIHANYLSKMFQINENTKLGIDEIKNRRRKRYLSHDMLNLYRKSELQKFILSKNQNVDDDLILNEIVEEMSKKNFEKNSALFKSLSEISRNFSKKRNRKVCAKGFDYRNNCRDVNECSVFEFSGNGTLNNCDSNAACINTFGSFKCRCNKGFIGNGTLGNCFSGKFCSGRFCRQNGECVFKNNRNGYKCKCMLECMNGGVCILTKYKYECKCPKNSTGFLCNETVQDNIEKLRFDNHPNNLYSIDKFLLDNLVDLVEPTWQQRNKIKFKMLDLFESYLGKLHKKNAFVNM